MKLCTIDGCDSPARGRGWCSAHYARWRRSGDPTKISYLRNQTDETRFWFHVDSTAGADECWPWTGSRNPQGYGRWAIRGVGSLKAHRAAYEFAVGAIPDGRLIRHTCDNPPCCNPAHLIPGTHKDNARDREERGRGNVAAALAERARRRQLVSATR